MTGPLTRYSLASHARHCRTALGGKETRRRYMVTRGRRVCADKSWIGVGAWPTQDALGPDPSLPQPPESADAGVTAAKTRPQINPSGAKPAVDLSIVDSVPYHQTSRIRGRAVNGLVGMKTSPTTLS